MLGGSRDMLLWINKTKYKVFARSDYWTLSASRRYKHVCLNITLINTFTMYALLSSNNF